MSQRERQILDAAAKVFREKGYQRATIEDVAKEVGILKGSLYYYIKNKNELLFKIGIVPLKTTTEELKSIVQGDAAPSEKLKKAIRERIRAFEKYHTEMTVFFQEKFEELPEEEREILRNGQREDERLWSQIIYEGIEKGEFRENLDVKIITKAIMGMCHWLYKWYRVNGRLTADEIADIFYDLIFNGIKQTKKE